MAKGMRTAVLVVHGMGSQRPLDTARGVIDAVWFNGTENQANGRSVWTHPEPSGVDIDLTVMTTSHFESATGDGGTETRSADFHELYWAHLMSETRAVAVLLWLFELGRKGPRFSTAMNALWFSAAIFLCLLILSVTLIALKVIIWFCSILEYPEWLLFTPLIMLSIGTFMGFIAAALTGAGRLAIWLAITTALIVGVFLLVDFGPAIGFPDSPSLGRPLWWANVLLPFFLSIAIVLVVMGAWGLLAHAGAYALSWLFVVIYLNLLPSAVLGDDTFAKLISESRLPWSLASSASTVAAWVFVGVYLAAYAAFLQPFLGDAARYFRNSPANVAVRREIRKQAVGTLDLLHRLRNYDRIVVVAHSLGTVVAYDMLRAYYSGICNELSLDGISDLPGFQKLDKGKVTDAELRSMSRGIIREMATKMADTDECIPAGQPPEAWLVTDFVTMGSPLTHARYLMCLGRNTQALKQDFARRVKEREFPTCPPAKAGTDGWLTFKNPRTGRLTLHHGSLFALTRWTNLYFPISQLFWGDAIGGPVRLQEDKKTPLFGSFVQDKEVWTKKEGKTTFFSHTKYWDIKNGRDTPQIVALCKAINLGDA